MIVLPDKFPYRLDQSAIAGVCAILPVPAELPTTDIGKKGISDHDPEIDGNSEFIRVS